MWNRGSLKKTERKRKHTNHGNSSYLLGSSESFQEDSDIQLYDPPLLNSLSSNHLQISCNTTQFFDTRTLPVLEPEQLRAILRTIQSTRGPLSITQNVHSEGIRTRSVLLDLKLKAKQCVEQLTTQQQIQLYKKISNMAKNGFN